MITSPGFSSRVAAAADALRDRLRRPDPRISSHEYLTQMPDAVPPGRLLVHNHVLPQPRLGWNGFRAWLQAPDTNPELEPCPCPWASELGQHYRVAKAGH